jgi:hypothetical protein
MKLRKTYQLDRAIAQVAIRRLVITAARVRTWVNPVGVLTDKGALKKGFSEFFGFPLSVTFHRCSKFINVSSGGPLAAAVPLRQSLTPITTTTNQFSFCFFYVLTENILLSPTFQRTIRTHFNCFSFGLSCSLL